ncbi:MBL fold metallo-hydrolase [Microvirga sp. W0021]|uniref:MBL fold metallo-hydrolase n=1 Tax=Hohaiivirga grylli TaxID=3133970 RepID=A0ABV0BIW8_9HYPH
MALRLTILGCGSSGGVPRAASAGWGACDPTNTKNRRRRCSVFVERYNEHGTTSVLVDTSPDLREQLLSVGPQRLDAVLYTHEHADHTHGIDDLRPLVIDMHRRMPVYASRQTMDLLLHRFGYCFKTPAGSSYPPILEDHLLEVGRELIINGPGGAVSALPFLLHHGDIDSFGFRFGKMAYAPDVSRIPDASLEVLKYLDLLVLDALRDKPHPTHLNVEQALEYIEFLKPKHAILTNLHNDLDYEVLRQRLPSHIEPAYDGLTVTISE